VNQRIATPSTRMTLRVPPASLGREASIPSSRVAPWRMPSGDSDPSRLLPQDHPSCRLGGDAACSRGARRLRQDARGKPSLRLVRLLVPELEIGPFVV